MIIGSGSKPAKFTINRNLVKFGILLITCILALASLEAPIALRPSAYPLQIGDVSAQDILAPYSLTFQSDLQTKAAQQQAAANVSPVYLDADPTITRQQIERFNVVLYYITTVRLDSYATLQQKLSDLHKLTDLQLNDDDYERILSLNDYRWQLVEQEGTDVLEQVMRNTIRQDNLNQIQRSIPSLVSFSMPQDQAALVVNLVTPFVVDNSLYSASQTEASRQKAVNAVKPVMVSYVTGQTIVRRGQIITAEEMEILQKYDLVQPKSRSMDIFAGGALVILIAFLVAQYFYRRRIPPFDDLRGLALLSALFLIFLVGARLLIPNRVVVPYLYPLPAYGLIVAALFNMELGILLSMVLSVLSAYGLSNSLDLTVFYVLTSFCGILILGRARRIATFFWSGMAIGLSGIAIVLVYRLPDTITDWIGITTLAGASIFNGLASASLTLLFQYLIAQILGMTTALQLLDLSRPDNPLLLFILRNAPGTYQHSLQVANLAEQAAEKIGADSLLARVGSIYHDAGKSTNPGFFIENQIPGKINPHDELDPVTSASIILQHVTDGVQLAKKYRLPNRIQDFIREHHGTMIAKYQYAKAVEAAGNQIDLVDKELFRYPGPRPRSRETALLMMADGVEARARSDLPKNEAAIRLLVKKMIDLIQKNGQLDDTSLTFKDLNTIVDSFTNTLRNTYHPRIQYPELKVAPTAAETGGKSTSASQPAQPPARLPKEPVATSPNTEVLND
jgi:putative nucleotidyltransferase with HDIG domain